MKFAKVVVDADALVYKCGFAAEGEPLEYVLSTVKRALLKTKDECNAEEMEVYIKGTGNFRESVAVSKGYKAQRSKKKPRYYEEIRDYLQTRWGAIQVDEMEADDMVSMLLYEDYVATSGKKDKATLILSSPDKDLNNTPGWHHNHTKNEVRWISGEQALRHFWFQMLAGDKADNIPGLPSLPPAFLRLRGIRVNKSVGDKTAKALLTPTLTAEDAEKQVYHCYQAWGLPLMPEDVLKDYIVEQGTLLWMLRREHGGQPVHFKINEELYERAKRDYQYPEDGTKRGGEGGHTGEDRDPLSTGEWESEYSDKLNDSLCVQPNSTGC